MADFEGQVRLLLEHAREEQTLIAVHEHPDDTGSFVAGFVARVSPSEVTLKAVNPRGQADGVQVIRLENVRQLHWESEYLRRLQILFEDQPPLRLPIEDADSSEPSEVRRILWAAMETKALVTLHGGDKITGFVQEVGEDCVQIESILETGLSDGKHLIPLEEVARLDADGVEEQLDSMSTVRATALAKRNRP